MRERRSRISGAHDKTFRWIFDKDVSGPWDSFTGWLRSEEPTYWISGKPGSGKSTHMKYLVDQEATNKILREWDPSVAVISFFLWTSGFMFQKSVQGLLCAVINQLLQADEELTCTLLAGDQNLLEKKGYYDWSDEELEILLFKAINTSKRRVCLFLDGLDETDRKEGPFPLIQLVQTLETRTNAKLCLSSRPEAEFRDTFGTRRTLRLEDLTREDISIYVEDYFQEHLNFWERAAIDGRGLREEIMDEVLWKASGVFLWVFLVLRSLRSGTSNLDSHSQLLRRVRQLPSTLEQLYEQVWKRQGESEYSYCDEVASYFKLVLQLQEMMDSHVNTSSVLASIPLSLLEFLFAYDSHLREGLLENCLIPPANVLISKTHELQSCIETRSGGLLEVFCWVESDPEALSMDDFLESCLENFLYQFLVPFSNLHDPEKGGPGAQITGKELAELWSFSHNLSVGFIHRTAVDFVSKKRLEKRSYLQGTKVGRGYSNESV